LACVRSNSFFLISIDKNGSFSGMINSEEGGEEEEAEEENRGSEEGLAEEE
jgi:hypothetical protein